MLGTLINVVAIVLGSAVGLLFGARLPERMSQTIMAGLGLFTIGLGLQMFFGSENPIVVLGGLLVGGVLGEWWKIETKLANLGAWLEKRFAGGGSSSAARFVKGFLTTSLLFCIGPMAILGAIQDGLTGDYSLLAIKAVLDVFASLAFAATLGVGVVFSAGMVLLYQGGITLLAEQAQAIISEAMMAEMTAVGGIMLVGLAMSSLLELKEIRVGNFLPALFLTPLLVFILETYHLAGY
jgi:uncharacterized membrane protein YqgA involved in biofilm formation